MLTVSVSMVFNGSALHHYSYDRLLQVLDEFNYQWPHRFDTYGILPARYLILFQYHVAQQQNGSTIVIEHRFYGFSNPYPDLSVESLRVHTLQQAVDDLVYFAKTVNLPMPGGDQVTPDKAPWILIGGSYSGAC
jgi:hypothetical protein